MYHTSRPVITGKKGVVSSGHYLATMAGIKMLSKGGNAIDAGVAAGFALAALKPNENSLGGECPILIYSPSHKKVFSISGLGTAPKKATIEWFRKNGIKLIPGNGFLGAMVPGLFGGYATALMKFGRLTLKDVLEPVIEIATEGFPVYKRLSETLAADAKKYLEEWPSTAEVFLPGGKAPSIGQILKQPALAQTFKSIVQAEEQSKSKGREQAIQDAADYFYKGEIAEKILEFSKNYPVKDVSGSSHTALLEMEDFLEYETRIEEPVHANYRNYNVYKCGPWTQGPVFLQQLKLLEGFELGKMKHNSAEYIHLLVECSKLAFADRNKYYGDPRFNDVALDMLLSEEYNSERRMLIDLNKANGNELDAPEEDTDTKTYVGDTTHLDVIDDEGFMMSATPSGGWIPSSPVIPALGFPLGTRMQCMTLNENHPNGLMPGKRPRITLTPSLVFKDEKPWIIFGTPGGDCQDQWTLQFFLNLVDFNMDMQEAIDKPAFHTMHFRNSFYPKDIDVGTVFVEKGIDMEEMLKLQDMGHKISILRYNDSEVNSVRINHDTGAIEGAASFKYDGQSYAFGW